MSTNDEREQDGTEVDRSWMAGGIVAAGGGLSGLYWLLTKHLYSEGYLTATDSRLAIGVAVAGLIVMLLFAIILAENEVRRFWGDAA